MVQNHKLAFRRALEAGVKYSEEMWERFSSWIVVHEFKKGEIITPKGAVDTYLSVVSEGLLRNYVVKDGQEISFDFSFEYDFCSSYASLISKEPSIFYIEALEDTVLARVPYHFIENGYESSIVGERSGRKSVERYYVEIEKRLVSMLQDSPEERYLKLVETYPQYIQRIPQKHLASYLGIKPETLSRLKRKIYSK